jgi:hypothetical protein
MRVDRPRGNSLLNCGVHCGRRMAGCETCGETIRSKCLII